MNIRVGEGGGARLRGGDIRVEIKRAQDLKGEVDIQWGRGYPILREKGNIQWENGVPKGWKEGMVSETNVELPDILLHYCPKVLE